MTRESCMLICAPPRYEVIREQISDLLRYRDVPVLVSELTLPRLRTHGAAVDYIKINGHYSDLAASLRNRARLELYPEAAAAWEAAQETGADFTPYSLTTRLEATLVAPTLLSLVVDVITDTGAVSTVERCPGNWLVCSGQPLKPAQFFRPDCRWEEHLRSRILAEIPTREGLYEDAAQLAADRFNRDRFYLTCDDLVVFYPAGVLAPAEAGIVEFRFPLCRLRYCIREQFLRCRPDCCDDCDCGQQSDFLPPFDLPPLCR